MVRGFSRAVAGLALVAAVSACDDNPLAENRDRADYFRLNPVNAVVNIGSEVNVQANILNRYGAALDINVSATPCDNKVSVRPNPIRSAFEFPELFLIKGESHGESCVVVTGGGVTDTIKVRVVPASIVASAADAQVASGSTTQILVAYRAADGSAAPGVVTDTRTTYAVATAAVGSVSADGVFSAQAPGTTWVRTTFTDLGVTRRDSVQVTVVAGQFSGTVTQGTTGNVTGSIAAVTFTEGAVPFDNDTQVLLLLGSDTVRTHSLLAPANQRRVVLPYGLPAGDISYSITNMGPNQIAAVGTINLPTGTPAEDPFEPDNTVATPKAMAAGDTIWGSLSDADARDMVALTITTAGQYRVSMGWNDGSDHDLYVRNPGNTASLLSLEGGVTANPETGLVTLAVGTYWLRADVWTHNAIGGRASTYYMTAVFQP